MEISSEYKYNSSLYWTNIAKKLRSELVAIGYDAQNGKIAATTSSTTGVAGRINNFIDEIDQETGKILAN